jgi:AcrR family transcriptional regulator
VGHVLRTRPKWVRLDILDAAHPEVQTFLSGVTVAKLPKRRRSPKQRRANVTVDAIVQATREILERSGPTGLTTNAIAERAGVGIASVYRYFPNLDAIMVELCRAEIHPHTALHDALLDRDPETIAPFREMALSERLRFIGDRSVRVQRKLARLIGPDFYVTYFRAVNESSGLPTPEGVRLMELVLSDRWHEAPRADRALAPLMLHALVTGGVASLVSYADETVSDDSLVESVVAMAMRYLGAHESS